MISNTAIKLALQIGYEEGWIQADIEKLEALAPTLLSAKNRDLTPRLLEILRGGGKSDPVVTDVAEESTAPEDELDLMMEPFPEPRPSSERSDSAATNGPPASSQQPRFNRPIRPLGQTAPNRSSSE
ncbi:hypothetical protein [Methylosinus sp. Ce-a6]|uniref:hypothetical protein n=1 Tax=Methylosinus sp. Ce-a6 TaxID=2172005 RepID=UPI001358AA7C|nr:hypothetical protein [Methylosinus sp. Ce-a6]